MDQELEILRNKLNKMSLPELDIILSNMGLKLAHVDKQYDFMFGFQVQKLPEKKKAATIATIIKKMGISGSPPPAPATGFGSPHPTPAASIQTLLPLGDIGAAASTPPAHALKKERRQREQTRKRVLLQEELEEPSAEEAAEFENMAQGWLAGRQSESEWADLAGRRPGDERSKNQKN